MAPSGGSSCVIGGIWGLLVECGSLGQLFLCHWISTTSIQYLLEQALSVQVSLLVSVNSSSAIVVLECSGERPQIGLGKGWFMDRHK